MFKANIFVLTKGIIIKFIYILTIITFLSCVFLGMMDVKVYAAQSQYTEKYSKSSFDSKTYPGYATLIDNLQVAHPNWTFTILYTGLDWNQVIKNETTATHGRNLITGSKTGEWVCPTCSSKKYDNGSWKCASEATVSYYMDPRNSLFEDYIFQFENLKWVDGVYTVEGINKILSDCNYAKGSTVTYKTTSGGTATINKSFAQIILDAAKENKVSAYHLAARIRQEQGTGNLSSTAKGTYTGYVGYYNYFNVNATGSGDSTIITNALKYAKTKGWTDPEKSIKGGAKFVADEYINDGQNTLYLQKFDVDSSDGSLYWHQYMQNVSASKTEGSTIIKTYKSIDSKLSQAFNFVIPVYKNMPDTRCEQPGSQVIVTQNVEVTENEVVVRESQNATSKALATLKKGTKILRIEIGNTKTNGYIWDKIVLDNGTKGYIVSGSIKVLEDITNCNKVGVATTAANVRNGPGTSGTKVITTLTKGQTVTIIETGKYKNINGENWSRVYLSDGRQGYIVERYLQGVNHTATGNSDLTKGGDVVEVLADGGLAVREKPGTDQKILKYVYKGDYLTRIDKAVSTDDGYTWDKIITDDGIEGYTARGNDTKTYLKEVSENNTEIKGTGVKTSGTNIVCEPNITVENIKKISQDVVVKNPSGTEVKSGIIGTGYTIKSGGRTFTVVKKGDTNGDGKSTPADSTNILRAYVGLNKISEAEDLAADANKDGKLTPADATVILRAYVGLTNISI